MPNADTLTSTQYRECRKAIEDVFLSLYIVDAGSLTPAQRKEHQAALSSAYLAVIAAENRAFSALTDKAKQKMVPLAAATLQLQKDLAGLKRAAETLQIVSGALNVFSAITRLLK